MLTKIIAEKYIQKKEDLTGYLAKNYRMFNIAEYALQELVYLAINYNMASSDEDYISLSSDRMRFPLALTEALFDDSIDKDYVKLLAEYTAYFFAPEISTFSIPIMGVPAEKPIVGLDLVSGPNFSSYFPTLSPLEKWYAVDRSFYVCSYLNTMKNIFKAGNIEILNEDINNFEKPAETFDIVRAKNLFTYVPEADEKTRVILNEWLRPGGKFLVPLDSYQDSFNYKQMINFADTFGNDMRSYMIDRGWTFEYRENPNEEFCAKYLLIFNKPDEKEVSAITSEKSLALFDALEEEARDMLFMEEGFPTQYH